MRRECNFWLKETKIYRIDKVINVSKAVKEEEPEQRNDRKIIYVLGTEQDGFLVLGNLVLCL